MKKEFKLDEKIVNNANQSWNGYTGKIEVEDVKEFIKEILKEINKSTRKKEFLQNDYDFALIYSFEKNVRRIIKRKAGDLKC